MLILERLIGSHVTRNTCKNFRFIWRRINCQRTGTKTETLNQPQQLKSLPHLSCSITSPFLLPLHPPVSSSSSPHHKSSSIAHRPPTSTSNSLRCHLRALFILSIFVASIDNSVLDGLCWAPFYCRCTHNLVTRRASDANKTVEELLSHTSRTVPYRTPEACLLLNLRCRNSKAYLL